MSEIIGVLFAILVGTLVIPKFADYQKISNDNTRAATTAQQQKQLIAAGSTYIQQNSVAIQATATATTPAVITVAMLQDPSVNLLPASFSSINPFGQTWQVEVLQPSAGNLQALAMSTGGTALPDAQAGKIAAIVGASGGLIPQNDSGIYPGAAANAFGSFAGWTISTANYTSITGGHPAALMTFNNGQLVSNYLYRNAVPGQPQLNTMNTPLVMGSVQTADGACATTGAIAQDGAGGILSCQGGVWKAPGGGKCVSTSADLNNLQTDGRCYNGVALPNSPAGGDWVFVEVYRHTNTANYYVAQRVVGMTGAAVGRVWQRNQQSGTQAGGWSAWVQQADPSINIANNQILGSGSQGSYGATTVSGQKNGWTGLEFRDSSGNYQINQMTNRSNIGYYDAATGRWLNYSDVQGNLTLDQTGDLGSGRINPGWAVETWGCTTGQIGKAAYNIADGWAWNGKTLSCVNGIWKAAGGGGALNMSAYGIPANATIGLGNHVYCAMSNSAGYSWGATWPTAYVGNNANGSPMYSWNGINYGTNAPIVTCLDQS